LLNNCEGLKTLYLNDLRSNFETLVLCSYFMILDKDKE